MPPDSDHLGWFRSAGVPLRAAPRALSLTDWKIHFIETKHGVELRPGELDLRRFETLLSVEENVRKKPEVAGAQEAIQVSLDSFFCCVLQRGALCSDLGRCGRGGA